MIVGIDGGTHTGIALFDTSTRKFTDIKTTDFWGVFELLGYLDPGKCQVVVESLNTRGALYARTKGEAGGRDKFAANVGSVRRETELLITGLEKRGFNVRRVRPSKAKWTREELKRNTGWDKQTSQHGRDAAKLCFS